VRTFIADLRNHDRSGWRRQLADAGYLAPHWPRPWGRDASPVEQLVIDQELRAGHIRRTHLAIAGWVLPTLIAHGSPEQRARFISPSLRGEIRWCQMFSEPGAGSDLASLSTRAERVDGGWSINGQRCGRRWPGRPTGPSAWPARMPVSPSTRGSAASWWT
jgi:alkylation response protein AidB-like acyl-CoA dehydrogenase